MSESKPLVKLQRLVLMSEYSEDMAAAAQQLMQLSDEDNGSSISSSNSNGDGKKMKATGCKRLFEEQTSHRQDEITSAMIEEIFGKEEEILRPINNNKKRRYRFIESIYKETKPIKVSHGKNLWY